MIRDNALTTIFSAVKANINNPEVISVAADALSTLSKNK
jgi:hypothetical protein